MSSLEGGGGASTIRLASLLLFLNKKQFSKKPTQINDLL